MGWGVDTDVGADEDVAADIDAPRIKCGKVAVDEAEVPDVDVRSVVKEDGGTKWQRSPIVPRSERMISLASSCWSGRRVL